MYIVTRKDVEEHKAVGTKVINLKSINSGGVVGVVQSVEVSIECTTSLHATRVQVDGRGVNFRSNTGKRSRKETTTKMRQHSIT